MDRVEQYRKIIQQFLTDYATVPIANGEIDSQLIFDIERDHYQITNIGWDGNRRVHSCVLHLDIIDGKVWIQHNSTEMAIGSELSKMGIPNSDIILGFQAPYLRQYTDFGVA
ncbi:MAG: XisI protein [Microcoleus sp.]